MPELPSGTVTLLFTDIEGSTRLEQQLGDRAYEAVLAEHPRLVREALGAHGSHRPARRSGRRRADWYLRLLQAGLYPTWLSCA